MTTFREGDEQALTVAITEDMVRFFANWSGDQAPLHTNDDFARKAGFEKRVVHGAVLFSMISRFVGMQFPGPKSLWLKSEVKFHHPCYAPSTVTISGKIVLVSVATASLIGAFNGNSSSGRRHVTGR